MVQAWYLRENITNQREPNHADPVEYVSLEDLKKKTGVLYWRVSGRTFEIVAVIHSVNLTKCFQNCC